MSGTPTTDHAHEPCDDLHNGLFKGRHCAACGESLKTDVEITVTASEPITGALGIVLRLAKQLDGMTVHEMELIYGPDLAEIFADAQAWGSQGARTFGANNLRNIR